MGTLTSPLTLASTRSYLRYPLLLSVCLCDSNGKQQCANISYIFTNTSVYRGETITLLAFIVGYDFGTTVGTIHARSLYSDFLSKQDQLQLVIDNETVFLWTIQFTQNVNMKLYCYQHHLCQYLLTLAIYQQSMISLTIKMWSRIKYLIMYRIYNQFSCIHIDILITPIFINITLLPGCPPELTLNHDEITCSCYPVLANNDFRCLVKNKTGLLQWNGTVWVNAIFNESHSTGIVYNKFLSTTLLQVR